MIKHLGVSNFNERQIQRLIDNSNDKPEVNQVIEFSSTTLIIVNITRLWWFQFNYFLKVELHVYFQQKPLVKFCQENNVIVTAYSPLGSRGIDKLYAGTEWVSLSSFKIFPFRLIFFLFEIHSVSVPDLLDNPVVLSIAEKHNKSPAQVLLRYIIESGITVIPKSTNENRLKANIDVFGFELTDDDKNELSELDAGIRLCDFRKFGFFKGIETHPEFPY